MRVPYHSMEVNVPFGILQVLIHQQDKDSLGPLWQLQYWFLLAFMMTKRRTPTFI